MSETLQWQPPRTDSSVCSCGSEVPASHDLGRPFEAGTQWTDTAEVLPMRRPMTGFLVTVALLVAFPASHGYARAEGGASGTGSLQPPFDLNDPAKVDAGSH